MIIWSGKGYYVLLVAIGCQVLAMMACKTILGDKHLQDARLAQGGGVHCGRRRDLAAR